MCKRIFVCLAAALLLLAPCAAQAQPVDVRDAAAILIEPRSGKTIMEVGAQEKMEIAGLARLPALLLICEAMDSGALSEEDAVRVSQKAAAIGGPTAFLAAGEEIDAGALLKSAVMITAGDAVYALSEALDASDEAFVRRVNARLGELGIAGNCTDRMGNGLLLSAEELAALGGALLNSPAFCAYSMLFYDSIQHESGLVTELASANRLLKTCVGCNGIATGSSEKAGYCGVYSAVRGDTAFLCVVLDAANAKARNAAAAELLDYAFATYQGKLLSRRGEVFAEDVPVLGGSADVCTLIAAADAYTLLPAGGGYTRQENIPEELEAPLRAGDVLGQILYLDTDGNRLSGVDLTVAEDIPEATLADRLSAVLRAFLHA